MRREAAVSPAQFPEERSRLKPRQRAPRSGTYRATDGTTAEVAAGQRLPSIPGGGHWEFVSEGAAS